MQVLELEPIAPGSRLVYEHIESQVRISFPYRVFDSATKSWLNFKWRMKCACEQVQFRTFIRLSYANEKCIWDGRKINVFDFYESSHVREFVNRLKSYYRKKGKELFDYAWRIDYGDKKGRPHWHMLTTAEFIYWKDIERYWSLGYIWVVRVKSQRGVQRYVSKYMAKTIMPNKYTMDGKRFRNYGFSQNLKFYEKPKEWIKVGVFKKEEIEEVVVEWNKDIANPFRRYIE